MVFVLTNASTLVFVLVVEYDLLETIGAVVLVRFNSHSYNWLCQLFCGSRRIATCTLHSENPVSYYVCLAQ